MEIDIGTGGSSLHFPNVLGKVLAHTGQGFVVDGASLGGRIELQVHIVQVLVARQIFLNHRLEGATLGRRNNYGNEINGRSVYEEKNTCAMSGILFDNSIIDGGDLFYCRPTKLAIIVATRK